MVTSLKFDITMAGDKQSEVTFDNVTVSKNRLLGPIDQGWPLLKKVLQKAAVAKCAEMVGGAQCALDIAAHDLWGKLRGQPVWKLWGSAMVPSDGVEDAMGRYVESGDGPLNADI